MIPALFTRMSTRPPEVTTSVRLGLVLLPHIREQPTLVQRRVHHLVALLNRVVIGKRPVAASQALNDFVRSGGLWVVDQYVGAQTAKILGVGAAQAVAGASHDGH